MRFPTAQISKDWGRFRPVGMRIAEAQIAIDLWNSSTGAKAELQSAWCCVKGVPHDKSVETLAYVGSLVGVTVEVDQRTLHKQKFVRVRIGCRDVTRVPEVAEGTIWPYLYDFKFEREEVMSSKTPDIATKFSIEGGGGQPTPKKQRIDNGCLGNIGASSWSSGKLLVKNVGSSDKQTDNTKNKQVMKPTWKLFLS